MIYVWLMLADGIRCGALVGTYDTFFLDWVLFVHLPMFRLPGTEHMDKAYAQKCFYVKGMLLPGLLFALIPGVLTGLIAVIFLRQHRTKTA